jgi:D-ribose pyranose/furanose isomerase RbsD
MKRIFVIIEEKDLNEIRETFDMLDKFKDSEEVNIIFIGRSLEIKDKIEELARDITSKISNVNLFSTERINDKIRIMKYSDFLNSIRNNDVIIKVGFTCPYSLWVK